MNSETTEQERLEVVDDAALKFLSESWFAAVEDLFLAKYVRHIITEWSKVREEIRELCVDWQEKKNNIDTSDFDGLYESFLELTELDREVENYKFVADKLLVECIRRGIHKTLLPLFGIVNIELINKN